MIKNTATAAKFFPATLRVLSFGIFASIFGFTAFTQPPSPSPSAEDDRRYSVTASTEIGGRWVDVSGNENKFRSDLNYRNGFRLFDSSILIEDNGGDSTYKPFDSALIIASGWGADPSGMVRLNLERDGIYRLDTNIRRVGFFNNLNNHAVGASLINYHNYDTRRNFGDIDLTLLPNNRKIRFRVGGSYSLRSGTFTFTSRASDVFPVESNATSKAYDFRGGVDAQVLGFNLSGTYGYRNFDERTSYRLLRPDPGDVTTGTRVIDAMERRNPIDGTTHYGVLSVQRTFANRLDFTAKILHSMTRMDSRFSEFVVYRTPLTRDEYNITGDAVRPQTRGDLGITWRVTDKFRLSNTFSVDSFHIDGGLFSAQNVGISLSPTFIFTYNVMDYRRVQNLFEGDYQFSDRFAVNVGYRYTTRDAHLVPFFRQTTPTTTSIIAKDEDVENTTHTVIAGTKVKPLKNWSIYADIEKGKADTVFTRAGNADFLNWRIRSQMRFDKMSANVSFISKDNEFPTDTTSSTVGNPRITDTSSRTFSATLDWYPTDAVNISGGYNYLHLTSLATVKFYTYLVDAPSEYYVRDSYFFIDASVRPHKRISLFGSYRWNKDRGQGDRVIPTLGANAILGGYPFDFKTPEVKAAIRLNKYIDWNIGYQYYDYSEEPIQNIQWSIPFQNYKAHMPYTSVRIYLGKGSSDR